MRSFTASDLATICSVLQIDPRQAHRIVIEPGTVSVTRKGHDGHGNITHIETVFPVLPARPGER